MHHQENPENRPPMPDQTRPEQTMSEKTTVILEIHNPPPGRMANEMAAEIGAFVKDYLEGRGCDYLSYGWEEPATGEDADVRIHMTLTHAKGGKRG